MTSVTHENRLHGWQPKRRTLAVEQTKVTKKRVTIKPIDKPARITRRQLTVVISLLNRVAKGGDATVAVDARTLLPLLARCLVAAPVGSKAARVHYDVTLPDGRVQRLHGLKSVVAATGKAQSTIANALNKGGGAAEFPCRDELGNPAVISVRKAEGNRANSESGT